MTNTQAVQADIFPFNAELTTIEKALTDYNLTADDTYSDRLAVAKASISVLKQFLALTNERQGDFSQSYDVTGLKARIAQLEKDNGLTASSGFIKDASGRW